MLKRKYLYFALISVLIASIAVLTWLFAAPANQNVDVIALNRLSIELSDNWDDTSRVDYGEWLGTDISVITIDNALIFGDAIGTTYKESLNRALRYGYPTTDIIVNGVLVGKIIVLSGQDALLKTFREPLAIALPIFYAAIMLIQIIYIAFVEIVVYRPFNKMSKYASFIASGQLDIPLAMDRGNIFGAFTESFNTMRLQINAAKAAEYRAYKQKNDFIAEVNHDLAAQIAVIKAAVECMQLGSDDSRLTLIESKIDEMERMLNDLLITNLNDAHEFQTQITAIDNLELNNIISMCDYKRRVNNLTVETCVINADKVRTAQVIGNLITNSYKYADTSIDIEGKVLDNRLVLSIRDYGNSLDVTELDSLTDRYYRGTNAHDSIGAGLGLYIAKTLMRLTGGDIYLEYDNGLIVVLVFPLAS